jgi:hypothetical protein
VVGKSLYVSSKEYANLVSHVTAAHPEYAELTEGDVRNTVLIKNSFYNQKVRTYWGWLDWIIGDLLPFSCCEKPKTRPHSKVPPISS